MPSITFQRWEAGLDRRKSQSVADANRLLDAKNVYINFGWTVTKRPGLTKVATLETGTVGLFSHNNKLNTFYNGKDGAVTHANTLFVPNNVQQDAVLTGALQRIWGAEVFNGFIYAGVQYSDGSHFHNYLDGTYDYLTTFPKVADVNCPHGKSLIRASSKIFTIDETNNTVAFSATNAPKDWTTVNDAGFLPTNLQAPGDPDPLALGQYNQLLAVFGIDSLQTWVTDADPAFMAIDEIVRNVGCEFPLAIGNISGDTYFLSRFGFRSLSTLSLTNNLADVDVGSPIDALIIAAVAALPVPATGNRYFEPTSVFFQGKGQFLVSLGTRVYVFTFSRTSKISAWTYYDFPFQIDYMTELNGELYLRSSDDVYKFDDAVFTDDGTTITCEVQTQYLDFKKPGQRKLILGSDVVMDGEAIMELLYDPNDTTLKTPGLTVSGDTRRDGMLPVELNATEASTKFTHTKNEAWRLDLLTYYYDNLGLT